MDEPSTDSESSSSPVRKGKGWWRASEPPEESFSDVDVGQEWQYQIIGEEVDGFGNIWCEVRWDDWSRADGTKTTWEDGSTLSKASWNTTQRYLRQAKAAASLEIEILHTTDIHNTSTHLRNQADQEKAKRLKARPQPNFLEEMKRNHVRHQIDIGNLPISYSLRTQRQSTRTKTEIPSASSSTSTLLRSQSRLHMPSITSVSTPTSSSRSSRFSPSTTLKTLPSSISSIDRLDSGESPVMRSPMKRSRKRIESPDSESSFASAVRPSHMSPSTSRSRPAQVIETPDIRRMKLQNLWTTKAEKQGAAPISFYNNVDDEAIPPIGPNFCYLEASYKFAPGVRKPSDDFLVTCSCHECLDAALCSCQDASEIVDDDGNRTFAYTRSGFFDFGLGPGTEVIECNKLCSCSLYSCKNRVSQRPRDIPIEIFKSSQRGWGVRPLINVKYGKVVGLYSGLVIKREAACGSLTSYCFDLDGDEGEDRELAHQRFTVDSRLHGNWTRFINHSCSPNLGIYLVVHDTPPGTGMPFIVFVASCDIPARTEFTFDYDPKAAQQALQKSKKKKGKRPEAVPEGAIPCLCGSSQCRGYL
ncbi:SET domain-containing protein [Phlegmacium glaucopus]|nr:SET domain-containing protein [Phlegmacium glaucopus]